MAYVKASERRSQLVAAARAVLCRDGVSGTTLRAVATEAGVPLGTLHYVFPSKEELLVAVLEDVREEVSAVFRSSQTDAGLEHAIRYGVENYWRHLVVSQPAMALMRHELFVYALRTPELGHLARFQIEGYVRIVAEWCQVAARNAGEVCELPFETLGRVLVGSVIGVVLHYLSDRDQELSRRDVQAVADMLVVLAGVRPASKAGSS